MTSSARSMKPNRRSEWSQKWCGDNRAYLLRSSSVLCACCLVLFHSPFLVAGDIVKAELAKETAWTGEAVELAVTLYSPGPFSGTAAFDLPELPGTAILNVGSPVVGSETVEGESLFSQRHVFLIFTQQSGLLTIPSFQVRFKGKKSFLGDAEPMKGSTPELVFESKLPPGTADLGFVVATPEFDAAQEWKPADKTDVFAGDVVQRTLIRNATGTTAMMFPPFEPDAQPGVRTYQANPLVEDKTERGNLAAKRIETIKYQFEQPGIYELPEATFAWWNTSENKLVTRTLKGKTINVKPVATGVDKSDSSTSPGSFNFGRLLWALLIAGLLLLASRPVRNFLKQLVESGNTPENVAAQKVFAACQKNDANDAYRSFLEWKSGLASSSNHFAATDTFLSTWNELEATLFSGEAANVNWSGRRFESAFRDLRNASTRTDTRKTLSALPELNP